MSLWAEQHLPAPPRTVYYQQGLQLRLLFTCTQEVQSFPSAPRHKPCWKGTSLKHQAMPPALEAAASRSLDLAQAASGQVVMGSRGKNIYSHYRMFLKKADWLLLASSSLEVQSVWLAADLLATKWRAGLHPVPSLASSSACPQSSNLLPQLPETGSDTSTWVVGCLAITDRFFCS